MGLRITFLGSGDAFGSGGRLQTCIHVAGPARRFLIDCGASSLIAMKRVGIAPNEVDLVLLSHLHGDHFGGIPFLVLEGQLVSGRVNPLAIAGPPGTRRRIDELMEAMFPGSSRVERRFALEVLELAPERTAEIGGVSVTGYPVRHPSGSPALALRVQHEARVVAYSGDTEWIPSLVSAGRDADLLVAEAYSFEREIPFHLSFRALMEHIGELRPKRLVVTHMSEEMLARVGELDCEPAEDGKVIEL
jgi:ribonuclease BN (tRNA processing enzyme)